VILVDAALVSVLFAVLAVIRRIVLALLLTVAVLALALTGRRRRLVRSGSEGSGAAQTEGRKHRGDDNDSLHPNPPRSPPRRRAASYVSVLQLSHPVGAWDPSI